MAIVKDSSIWENNDAFEAARKQDMSIRIGMVREARLDTKINQTKYVVEVFDRNNQMPVVCSRLDHFGGVYNYEEYTQRGIAVDKSLSSASKYAVRAGDVVIVAFAMGDSREGIILGGIRHPGRPEKIAKAEGIAYKSEFNGVQTSINKDGEYKVTFRGTPTNLAQLDKPSNGNNIPTPTYNDNVGTSYYQFDKTGSWTLSDSAKSDPQSIKVDKPSGNITITSGKVVVKIEKGGQIITTTTKKIVNNSADSITETTKDWSMTASSTAKIKSPKVAIGTDGTELLDEIVQLITNIGMLTAISPVGPCAPLMASPQWPGVDKVKEAINKIKGSL